MKKPRKATSDAPEIASAVQLGAGICEAMTGKSTLRTTRLAFPGRAKIYPRDRKALFLPYQSRWIRDSAKFKIMEKARQIGMTWSTGYRAAREIAQQGRMYDTWVSSRDEGQAILFLQDARQWAQLIQIGAKDLGELVYNDLRGKAFKSFEMQFDNGRILHSMSSNPDAQAGKRGTRILDEFALHPDPRKLYSIAQPGITWGGQMEIISTHRGNLNFFAELIREIKQKGNPKGFSLHTVTLQDALDDGFLYKLQEKLHAADPSDLRIQMDEAQYFDLIRSECADEETFLQEFMCQPADDKSAFLDWPLIVSAEYPDGEEWQTSLDTNLGELYIGVDVGRRHDLTVIWVMEKVNNTFLTRRVIELQNKPFSEQEAILWPLIAHHRVRRCCIDSTGLGMQLAERAQQHFGKYRVEGVSFTGPMKEELAYPVRALMEDRLLKIPGTKEIRADLRGIKKETTSSGNIRFTADSGKNGHSDRFWALALAIHAGKSPLYNTMPPIRSKIWLPSSDTRRSRSLIG
jgi:phage FluMu gp28-like protein